MFCRNCGAQNEDGTKFCSKCGAPLDAQQQQPVIQQAPQVVIQQTAQPKEPRNGGALACGIIGFIFGLIGAFVWLIAFSAMDTCTAIAGVHSDDITIRLAVVGIFGIGGSAVGLAGSILAFKFRRVPGIVCSGIGLASQVAVLITALVDIPFIPMVDIYTVIGLVLFAVAFGLSFKKPRKN